MTNARTWTKGIWLGGLAAILGGMCFLFASVNSPLPLPPALKPEAGAAFASSGKTDSDWAKCMKAFYTSAAKEILKEAEQTGAQAVRLQPTVNGSLYYCASPCNAGLSAFLRHELKESERSAVRIIFWKEPIYPGPSSLWINRLLSRSFANQDDALLPSWCDSGWFSVDQRGAIERHHAGGNGADGANILDLTLNIERIELRNDHFQMELSISGEGTSLFKETYTGQAAQVYWFLRGKRTGLISLGPMGTVPALLLILLVCAALIISLARLSGSPHEAAKIGQFCCLLSQGILLIFLCLAAIPREPIPLKDKKPIKYIVDTSSEVWLRSTPNDNGRVGYQWFARQLEDRMRDDPDIGDAEQSDRWGFAKWLWADNMEHSLRDIYQRERYRPEGDYELTRYAFSGHSKGYVFKEVGALAGVPRNSPSVLLNPRAELRKIDQRADSERQTLAVVLTGACAPSQSNVHEYFDRQSSSKNATNRLIDILTILAPTLPRTGDAGLYNYENGKLALAACSSDRLITLTDTAPDQQTWTQAQAWIGEQHTRTDLHLASPTVLPDPMYRDLPDLNDPAAWDIPRDLNAVRKQHLFVPEQQAAAACNGVVQRIKELLRHKDAHEEQIVFLPLHVFGRIPRVWLAVAAILMCIVGFMAFVRQYYNAGFLWHYGSLMGPGAKLGAKLRYYVLPLGTLVFLLSFFFAVIWRCRWQQWWTDFGSARWSFFAAMTCWLSWVVGPRLFFCMWGKQGLKGSGITPRYARGLAAVFLFVCLLPIWYLCFGIADEHVPGPTNFFGLFIVFLALIGLFLALPLKRHSTVRGSPGVLPWWMDSDISVFGKTSLIVLTLLLLRGAFPASLGGEVSQAHPWIAEAFTYNGFVISNATLWSLVGLAIACSDTQQENQKKSRVFCLAPLVSLITCIVLLIGG